MASDANSALAKRAVFGGTFNPLHKAHLEIALTAQQQCQLAEIIWVPTTAPHYKSDVVAFEHRLNMVQQAIAPYPTFSTAELRLPFAIETLTALQACRPASSWFWLIGLDALMTLPHWVGRAELVAACWWLVAPRGTVSLKRCQQVAAQLQTEGITLRWQLLQQSPRPISSSLIRQRCRAGLPIRDFVPAPVQAYIEQHGLYRL